MNEQVFFSVVIPLYNKEKYIKKALESVLYQSFSNFEIIVVDDGSTDNSNKIVKSMNDPRIKLLHQENSGPSSARNMGIQESKGKFIAFLDADDEWLPEKLEKQYVFHIANDNIVWSFTGFRAVGGRRIEELLYSKEGALVDGLNDIINGAQILTSTVVIKKSVFDDERILFNKSVSRSEDREVWLKVACLYSSVGNIKEILSIYRVNAEGSLSATGLDDLDFSFLSLHLRMESVLSTIKVDKKEKIEVYFRNYNLHRLLSIWGWTNSYKKVRNEFDGYIDSNTLDSLDYWSFLPKLIKKIIVKVYLKYFVKYNV